MTSFDRLIELAKTVQSAPRDTRIWLQLTGLDPATDFRNLDLRNTNFTDCDLTGFDFTGSPLAGCRFTRARVAGTIFDASHRANAALFCDALDEPSFPPAKRHFVVAGDNSIDLVPSADDSSEYRSILAGTAYQCAVACATLGNRTSFLGAISDDLHGDRIRDAFAQSGAEVLLSRPVHTPTSSTSIRVDESARITYQYTPGADRIIDEATLIGAIPRTASLVFLSGAALVDRDSTEIWLGLLRSSADRGLMSAIDPQVRTQRATDVPAYLSDILSVVHLAHIIKLSLEDLQELDPQRSPEEFARFMLGRNARLVVVTLGDDGAMAFSRHASAQVPAKKLSTFADTVAAGSVFMAGLLTALADVGLTAPRHLDELSSDSLEDILQYASVAASLACERPGLAPPTKAEVEAALGDY